MQIRNNIPVYKNEDHPQNLTDCSLSLALPLQKISWHDMTCFSIADARKKLFIFDGGNNITVSYKTFNTELQLLPSTIFCPTANCSMDRCIDQWINQLIKSFQLVIKNRDSYSYTTKIHRSWYCKLFKHWSLPITARGLKCMRKHLTRHFAVVKNQLWSIRPSHA